MPERLLDLHEAGQVVFFCGAGISLKAGLPTFSGLVNALYEAHAPQPSSEQRSAIKSSALDRAVGLLEAKSSAVKVQVRQSIEAELTVTKPEPSQLSTHRALLDLSQTRTGKTQLVTTNFDRLFHASAAAQGTGLKCFAAPLLPVPKQNLDGLVFLHGLLPESAGDLRALESLVVSSGDFGLAYLTERWAARFVTELFRNYSVCFVGYSLNDPVLRYMMDALAADKARGEAVREMFAFASFKKGRANEVESEWKSKYATPILYKEFRRHHYLHKTLEVWARTYRDGVTGKSRVIAEEAARAPDLSTKQDNFIGRVLWALSDFGAGPAKTFARLVPAPPIDWLEWLLDERFSDHDLSRFNVALPPTVALHRKFSYASRPAAVELNPRMELLTSRSEYVRWDSRMQFIGEWLLRYLGNRRLLHAVVGCPGRIQKELSDLISRRLNELVAMSPEERAQLLKGSPDAFPSNNLRRIWMVLAHQKNGRDSSPWADINLRELVKHCANHVDIELEVSRAFAPTLKFKPPLEEGSRTGHNQVWEAEPPISKLVDSDVVLGTTYPHNLLEELRGSTPFSRTLSRSLILGQRSVYVEA